MISERLMAAGTWQIKLFDGAPLSVLNDLTFFGHVVVTPVHVDAYAVDLAGLLALASYTGIYESRSDRRTALDGYGLAGWLGASGGLSDTYESAQTPGSQTFYTWLTAKVLTGGSNDTNGITEGAIENPGSSKSADIPVGSTPLTVLNHICRERYAREWRINPDGTLDADTEANMFVTTPTVVLSSVTGGRDGAYTGYFSTVDERSDVESWASRVAVTASDGGTGSAAAGSNPYYGIDGTAIERTMWVNSSEADNSTAAGEVATELADENDDIHQEIPVAVDGYDVRGEVEPGDTVYVYDPDVEIYDTANEVLFRGHTMHPLAVRVLEVRWPVLQGMGVYFVDSTSSNTIFDLTPWVVWEKPGATIGLNDVPRQLDIL